MSSKSTRKYQNFYKNSNFSVFSNVFNVKISTSLVIVVCLAINLTNYVISGSSPGAASSVFSSRGNNKQGRTDNNNNNNVNVNIEDWYEMTLSNNTFSNNQRIRTDTSTSLHNVPDEQHLIARLLRNYDPAARPVYNASKPVVIKFSFSLIQICDMDERNQILTTNVWLEQVATSYSFVKY